MVNARIHRLASAEFDQKDTTRWLSLEDAQGNTITVFLDSPDDVATIMGGLHAALESFKASLADS